AAVPPDVDLGQGLLDQVLRLVDITAEQPRRPEQVSGPRVRQLLELGHTLTTHGTSPASHTCGEILLRIRKSRGCRSPSSGPAPRTPSLRSPAPRRPRGRP